LWERDINGGWLDPRPVRLSHAHVGVDELEPVRGAGVRGVMCVMVVKGVLLGGRNPVKKKIASTVWRDMEVPSMMMGIKISYD